jgi:hypothetical protein
MVGIRESEYFSALRIPLIMEELLGHFDGYFHGGRAVI